MRYVITGKNMEVTDRLRQQIETKLSKLKKLLPENTETFVVLEVERLNHTIEVTIPLKKRILRGEVTTQDMYASIDEVSDVLEKQVIKYKERLKKRGAREMSYKDEFLALYPETDFQNGEASGFKIEKSKRFALKPMDAEEAVMEMELLGHGFFVFRNGETDEVNVVYKRKNNSYGLIEPEF